MGKKPRTHNIDKIEVAMKIAIVRGNVYEHINWLEDNVGKFIQITASGNLVGVGWMLQFIHNREGYYIDDQKIFVENDMLATEFILRFL